MNRVTQTTLIKNFQQSLMKISEELSCVKVLSVRDGQLLELNVGRIQGLAQGLDFFILDQEIKDNKEVPAEKVFGFAMGGTTTEEEVEQEDDSTKV